MTEHKSHYTWPSKYLLSQHHNRPAKKSITDPNSFNLSSSTNSLSLGREETKSMNMNDNISKNNTQKSFMETDSIGSYAKDRTSMSETIETIKNTTTNTTTTTINKDVTNIDSKNDMNNNTR